MMDATPEQAQRLVELWEGKAAYWREVAELFEEQAREGWLEDAVVAAGAARAMEDRMRQRAEAAR